MPSYKIFNNAKADLERIYSYGFREFGEQQADNYFHGIFKQFDKIAANPLLYQTVDHIRPGYRRCTYQSDSIYYRVNHNKVETMAILGGQDFGGWL